MSDEKQTCSCWPALAHTGHRPFRPSHAKSDPNNNEELQNHLERYTEEACVERLPHRLRR
jgi:hypothetical protein